MRHRDRPAAPRRIVRVGVTATALYLIAIALGWSHPGVLLYDGPVPLPPYRWVAPPPDLVEGNRRPTSGTGAIALGALESMPADVSTDDDQAAVTFAEGAIAMRPRESAADVRVVPLDPRTFAPAPRDLRFDGNAYRITASYARSGRPAALIKPAAVVLRFPVHATVLLRASSAGWVRLPTTRFAVSQQVAADTDRLGVFAAAAPAGITAARVWTSAMALIAAAALVLAITVMRLRRRGTVRSQSPPGASTMHVASMHVVCQPEGSGASSSNLVCQDSPQTLTLVTRP